MLLSNACKKQKTNFHYNHELHKGIPRNMGKSPEDVPITKAFVKKNRVANHTYLSLIRNNCYRPTPGTNNKDTHKYSD
jgi:hypothetical protein